MKKLTKNPSKPLTLNTEKVRDLAPLTDDTLRNIVGGGLPNTAGSSHTSGG